MTHVGGTLVMRVACSGMLWMMMIMMMMTTTVVIMMAMMDSLCTLRAWSYLP